MTAGVFDGVWPYGQRLYVYDSDSPAGRAVSGFLEPINLSSADSDTRDRAGTVSGELYRLIAAPEEKFPHGRETVMIYGTGRYQVLNVKEVFYREKVSHRECILVKIGEAGSDA